jgi:2-oxoglutarate/2-oxoacid ferredoxin oxidoreductase subunit alpha
MAVRLLQGSDALAEAAVTAGCRFFTGYPMLPFTGLLESMARRMPDAGGVCMNAASEIEAVNMTIGAAAAGARAGTGSCGQGIALMQEAVAEAALNEVPFVLFNMARGQQDYFQCTRGGGWGDYRTITLAPRDVVEAVEHTQLLFHLADTYRAPVILLGDYLIADTNMSVDVSLREYGPLPAKDWALDGSTGGTGSSRQIWSWDIGKANRPGRGPDGQWKHIADKFAAVAEAEQRHESFMADDAEYLVVSWGTSGPFVDYVVEELRAEGVRIGSFRPISLWPFPEAALAEAAAGARRVLVYELNAGQMLDDVRLSIPDRSKIRFIGGVSIDYSGMRQGELLQAPAIRAAVRRVIDEGD